MPTINGNFFDGMINLFQRSNDPYVQTPALGMNYFNFQKGAQYISVDGKESKIFRTTPQLFSVIYRRAFMLANGRWLHYDKNDKVIEKSALVTFLKRPNPLQAGNEWIIQQDIQKSVYGNTFIYILKGSQLQPVPSALWNLAPKGITIERTGKIWKQTDINEIITSYTMNLNGQTGSEKEVFDPQEILHRNIQDVDDPLVGTSPFHALKMPISNIRAAYGFRNVIMTEKGALGMISNNSKSTAGAIPLTAAERKNLEDQFTQNYGINDKQRSVIMSSASLQWQPMSYPTKDMMLFEEINEDTRTIIDAYGLNEALFSLGKGTTFSNYNEGEKAAYQDTIIPEGQDLAFGLSEKFGLTEKGERLELDFSHVPVLQEDEGEKATIIKTKTDAIASLVASGFSKPEINDIMGL